MVNRKAFSFFPCLYLSLPAKHGIDTKDTVLTLRLNLKVKRSGDGDLVKIQVTERLVPVCSSSACSMLLTNALRVSNDK